MSNKRYNNSARYAAEAMKEGQIAGELGSLMKEYKYSRSFDTGLFKNKLPKEEGVLNLDYPSDVKKVGNAAKKAAKKAHEARSRMFEEMRDEDGYKKGGRVKCGIGGYYRKKG